ncbi:MAG: lamin tail domain-containing protein, partial [Pikeienuella sp.]|uniref:lamin tail domain-containing protein n=1 Tax=Pikeienuella sp. TaxID=2831957 RepID=UPI00391DE5C7
MTAFINEFHYDNLSGDVGEFIEIAGPAGADLTGWSLVLYNGANGAVYGELPLAGVLADAGQGFGFLVIDLPTNGLQNGAPDGIALVDDQGAVVEFLSYEGVFTAVGGPADGMTSVDIGQSESGSDPAGLSLQRTGTGAAASDFAFAAPQPETKGAANAGQSFTGDGGGDGGGEEPLPPSLVINEILADPAGDLTGDANGDGTRDATQDEFVEIVNAGTEAADLSGLTLSDGVAVRHVFPEGTILGAGAAIVVFGGGTPAGDFGGALVQVASTGALGLNNGGDTVTLSGPAGVIDSVSYGGEGGDNQSLTRDPDVTGDFVAHASAAGSEGALFSPGATISGTSFVEREPVFTINEIDSDTPGTDAAEFIEIFDGGVGGSSLDGLTLVLFNGSNDLSYAAFDLSGFSTDENGFFVIGNEAVPNVGLVIPGNTIQNGADAAALYRAPAADFPNGSAPTIVNLVDAVVYDTNDADDTGLLQALGLSVQVNENENGLQAEQSLSRVPDGSGAFVAQAPTPGEANEGDGGGGAAPALISAIQGSSAGVTQVGVDDRAALEGQIVIIEAIV